MHKVPAVSLPRLLCIPFLMLPGIAAAHPHVYIDADLQLVFDGSGDLSAVQVEWAYDEFYSLLIIEDYGLDPDGDGVLTGEENVLIQGFDSDWQPESAGGLYLNIAGVPVSLAPPVDFTAEYRDGRLISRHTRPLKQPLADVSGLLVQAYDPEFYVYFTIAAPATIIGRKDCRVDLVKGDPYAAPKAYRAAINDLLGREVDPAEADLVTVDIGAAGADTIRVDCGSEGDK